MNFLSLTEVSKNYTSIISLGLSDEILQPGLGHGVYIVIMTNCCLRVLYSSISFRSSIKFEHFPTWQNNFAVFARAGQCLGIN